MKHSKPVDIPADPIQTFLLFRQQAIARLDAMSQERRRIEALLATTRGAVRRRPRARTVLGGKLEHPPSKSAGSTRSKWWTPARRRAQARRMAQWHKEGKFKR